LHPQTTKSQQQAYQNAKECAGVTLPAAFKRQSRGEPTPARTTSGVEVNQNVGSAARAPAVSARSRWV
jgi:hypothetical protein